MSLPSSQMPVAPPGADKLLYHMLQVLWQRNNYKSTLTVHTMMQRTLDIPHFNPTAYHECVTGEPGCPPWFGATA